MELLPFPLAFCQTVVPLLRTWPFVRAWLVGCTDRRELRWLVESLEVGGLARRSRVYVTAASGRGLVADRRAPRNVVFWPHDIATDASFNEFNLIVCRDVPLSSPADPQQRVHRLVYESLCVAGILAAAADEPLPELRARYHELDPAHRLFQKLG
jgi:chemotaxis protein methyltransferase CheR